MQKTASWAELAAFTEHVPVWVRTGIEAEDLLGRFDLSRTGQHDVIDILSEFGSRPCDP